MQHTLIAVFDNRTDAQSALDELLLSGFSREKLRLSEESTSIGDSSVTDTTEEEGFGASVKHFFSDLFGSDDVHSRTYSNAVSKGHHVLTVTASDEPEVERAADIVERFGPVDIDEKAAEWGGTGMRSPEAMRMGSAGSMQQSEGASLQFHDDRHLFAQQSLNDERPMGTTYQETMGEGERLSVGGFTSVRRGGVRVFSPLSSDQSAMDDDSYFRSHWDSAYSDSDESYDDYAPAYSYGREVANMYRGQPWNDVEMDVRKGWDSRNGSGGVSTWEQFKDAIRHGWNRLTN